MMCGYGDMVRDETMDRKNWHVEVGAPPKRLKNPTMSVANAGPPDTEYLYYPLHMEGVTLKGSLLSANIR